MKRYDERLQAAVERICLQSGETAMIDQGYYEYFATISEKDMRGVICRIIIATSDVINKNILTGKWNDEDMYTFVQMLLELLSEGKIFFTEDDGKMSFQKPIGHPAVGDTYNTIREKIENSRPLIRRVFMDIVRLQNTRRPEQIRLFDP